MLTRPSGLAALILEARPPAFSQPGAVTCPPLALARSPFFELRWLRLVVDEGHNLGPCLDTVRAQDHPTLQIIVLDDGSSDDTGLILAGQAERDPRITALSGGEPLPDGWFGKPWALQRAQEKATGAWLFFIDADVRLDPAAVSRVVAHGERICMS